MRQIRSIRRIHVLPYQATSKDRVTRGSAESSISDDSRSSPRLHVSSAPYLFLKLRQLSNPIRAVMLVAFLGLGCQEGVVPVLDTGRPFTLFGLLNPREDTQWVRVFPIEDRLVEAKPEFLDAVFTSTELQTSELYVWTDSLLLESDGKYSHVFWTPFRAEYGYIYRLEAKRSDGQISTTEVVVPREAELIIEEPYSIGEIVQPVFVQGEVPHLIRIEVEDNILFEQITREIRLGALVIDTVLTRIRLVFPRDDKKRKEEDGWRILINLSDDQDLLLDMIPSNYERPTPHEIYLSSIELRMIAANEEWDPPGGSWDVDALIQPGTMSNVENGFGFVGAGYRLKKEWLPAREWVERAGFRYMEL